MTTSTETVSPRMIHTTDDMWEAVREAADKRGVTMAQWVRIAIRDRLEHESDPALEAS